MRLKLTALLACVAFAAACGPAPMTREQASARLPGLRADLSAAVARQSDVLCTDSGRAAFKGAANEYLRARMAMGGFAAGAAAEREADDEAIEQALMLAAMMGLITPGDLPPEIGAMLFVARAAVSEQLKQADIKLADGRAIRSAGDMQRLLQGACPEIMAAYTTAARLAEVRQDMERRMERSPERANEIRRDYGSRLESLRRQGETRLKILQAKLGVPLTNSGATVVAR